MAARQANSPAMSAVPCKPRIIRTDIAVLYAGDEAGNQSLLPGEPRLFFTAPGYDGWPLVMLRLAEAGAGCLTELVTDAWRMQAPETLPAELDESGDRHAPDQAEQRRSADDELAAMPSPGPALDAEPSCLSRHVTAPGKTSQAQRGNVPDRRLGAGGECA
jgi:hypothetical protein